MNPVMFKLRETFPKCGIQQMISEEKNIDVYTIVVVMEDPFVTVNMPHGAFIVAIQMVGQLLKLTTIIYRTQFVPQEEEVVC
ncbi:MAG: hypothetical protein ACRC78_05595 [Planktothrix sp.]